MGSEEQLLDSPVRDPIISASADGLALLFHVSTHPNDNTIVVYSPLLVLVIQSGQLICSVYVWKEWIIYDRLG